MLDPLRTALATLTQAQYSRQASPDRAALDAAAAAALDGANRAKKRHGVLKTLWQRWSARAVQAEQHS
jgi:hypothetical protein